MKLQPGVFYRETAAGSRLVYFFVNVSEEDSIKHKLPRCIQRPAETIEDAVHARNEIILALRRGEHPFKQPVASDEKRPALTVRELLARYVQRSNVRDREKTRHSGNLTAFLGDRIAEDLTEEDLEQFKRERQDPENCARRPPGDNTVKLDLSFLRAAFNDAKEKRPPLIARSVFDSLSKKERKDFFPTVKKKFQRVADEDLNAILSNMGQQYQRPLRFLIETGMRAAEAFELTWDRVNTRGDTARLEDTKSGKPRSVPLSPPAQRLIGKRERGLVFKGPDGFSMTSSVGKAWSRACDSADIARRIHDLRGEFACRYVERGGSLKEAQEICGWSSLEVAARYLESLESRKREVLARPWRNGKLPAQRRRPLKKRRSRL